MRGFELSMPARPEFPGLSARRYDVRRQMSSIHPEWAAELTRVGTDSRFTNTVEVTPDDPTSIDVRPATLTTVNGLILARELPWVDAIYELGFEAVAAMARHRGLEPPIRSTDRLSAITLVTTFPGHRMDRHRDRNRYAFVLNATTHHFNEGGWLSFGYYTGNHQWQEVLRVNPEAGFGLAFEGDKAGHEVLQLRQADTVRVVVNCNYDTVSQPTSVGGTFHDEWYQNPG